MAVRSLQPIIWMQNIKKFFIIIAGSPFSAPFPVFTLTPEARLQPPNYDLSVSIWLVKRHNLSTN